MPSSKNAGLFFTKRSKIMHINLDYRKLVTLEPHPVAAVSNVNKTPYPSKLWEFSDEIEALNINYNKLTTLPARLFQLPNLKKLYLDGNRIEELPEFVDNPSPITHLSIANNKLKKLPKWLADLPLIYLDFSSNELTKDSVPSEILAIESLEYINFDKNKEFIHISN